MTINKTDLENLTKEAGVYDLISFGSSPRRIVFDFTNRTKYGQDGYAWTAVWAGTVAREHGITLTDKAKYTLDTATLALKGANAVDAREAAKSDIQSANFSR